MSISKNVLMNILGEADRYTGGELGTYFTYLKESSSRSSPKKVLWFISMLGTYNETDIIEASSGPTPNLMLSR